MATTHELDANARAADHLRNLYGDRATTDVVINCNGTEIHAHKIIISACPFFKGCCTRPFKEARTGVIKMPDDDPASVKILTRHLYSIPYCAPSNNISLTNHMDVHAIADKYAVPTLASEALDVARTLIDWAGAIILPHLAGYVKLAYEAAYPTAHEFKSLLVRSIQSFRRDVTEGEEYATCMRRVFQLVPEFAYDLHVATLRSQQSRSRRIRADDFDRWDSDVESATSGEVD